MDENCKHKLIIIDRSCLQLQGVQQVISFDEELIILDTNMGLLSLQGEELHIMQLNLEEGELSVEGTIKTIDYSEDLGKNLRGKGKSILSRMFQ